MKNNIVRSGFTMIELIVVLIIIGILMAGGITGYMKYVTHAKATQLESQLKQIEVAMAKYKAATGTLPRLSYLLETPAKDAATGNPMAGTTKNGYADDGKGYDALSLAASQTEDTSGTFFEHYSGPYLNNMDISKDAGFETCIKAQVGGHICMGTQLVAAGDNFKTTGITITANNYDASSMSINKGAGSEGQVPASLNAYNVFTIDGVEPEIAKKIYENVNGKNPTKADNLKDVVQQLTKDRIGMPIGDKYNASKRIIYKYSEIF